MLETQEKNYGLLKMQTRSRLLLWGGAVCVAALVLWVIPYLFHVSVSRSLFSGVADGSPGGDVGTQTLLRQDDEEVRKEDQASTLQFYVGFACLFVVLLLGATWGGDFFIRRHYQDLRSLHEVNEALKLRIEEAEAAEARVRESERRFRNIVQSSPMGVYLYELDEHGDLWLIDANPMADVMTGFDNQTLVGKTIEQAFPVLVDSEIPDRYKAAAREGTAWRTHTFSYEDDRIQGAYDVYAFQTSPGRMAAMFLEVTDRKKADLALAESRNMLRVILDTIPVRVFWKDREGHYLGCNVPFAHDAGVDHPDDVLGRTDDALSWAKNAGNYNRDDREVIASGVAKLNYEERQTGTDGKELWLRTSKIPLRNTEDDIIGVLGCYEDITERKQVSEAVRISEQRYRLLFESANDAIILATKDGFLDCNQRALEMFGCSRDEFSRTTAIEFSPEKQPDGTLSTVAYQGYMEAVLAGQAQRFEWLHKRRDGRVFHAEVSLNLLDIGGEALIQSLIRDISEQKRVEIALRESEERNRRILETMQDGVAIFEESGHVVYANQAFSAMYGYAVDELMRMHAKTFMLPDNQDVYDRLVQTVCGEGACFTGESQSVRKDGSVFLAEVQGTPVELGDYNCIMVVMHDISERRKVEEELQQHRNHLEELVQQRTLELNAANDELEAFVYSVSHDLRSPLRSMDGFSQAVLEDYGDQLDATGGDYLRRIRAAANRMDLLIDDLLNLSRVTRSAMKCERVNLSDIAHSLVAMFQQQEPDRDVEVIIEPDLKAYGDPGLLEVVLQNLLGNAWKFTGKCEQGCIRFSADQSNDEYVYKIEDNGAGFDMQYAHKLFGVFQRLHGAAEFEGTGVGLATVQRIIQRHAGRIWTEAEVGKGASFYFTLAYSGDTMGKITG